MAILNMSIRLDYLNGGVHGNFCSNVLRRRDDNHLCTTSGTSHPESLSRGNSPRRIFDPLEVATKHSFGKNPPTAVA
jgi:hypothetical protein